MVVRHCYFSAAVLAAVTVLLLGAACSRSRARPAEPVNGEQAQTDRAVARGKHGMIAAAHPLAVQIGVDVLKQGGTAVDAAIAVNAALGVMEPMSCGIGGDLFALVWDAKAAKLVGLNASGRSPRAISADKVERDKEGGIPADSPASWTVPGAVDGWFTLHARFGRLPMKDLLAPAIRAAREGVAVPPVIARDWRRSGRTGYAETFLPAPAEGNIFKNPHLARSYELIAEGGRDAYYKGPLAAAIVRFAEKERGFYAREDFADHRSDWVDPISTDYRGYTVWQIPPNGQGLSVLQMLNVLENFDLKAMGRSSADFWHTLIETKKLVFEDRARYYGRPEAMNVSMAALLAKDYARRRAKLIDPAKAAPRCSPGFEGSDTTYLATADADGNMVSLIQSNYEACGSGYVPDGLGFCLQDRGAQFSLVPGTPNFLEGGQRPFHTIIPGFVTKSGKPYLAYGVMGGDFQPQGHVQVLINILDFGMDLQQAGDAPRFRHLGSTEPAGLMKPMTDGGSVYLEPGVSSEVRSELLRRGHRMMSDPVSYGGYQAIRRNPESGSYEGATESRKDGRALGY